MGNRKRDIVELIGPEGGRKVVERGDADHRKLVGEGWRTCDGKDELPATPAPIEELPEPEADTDAED